jgi:ribonuclease-3
MEFLGDAVLGLVAARILYDSFPDDEEGELQKKRAVMVNRNALAQTARRLELAPFIRMGKGDDLSGCRERDSILADTVEAILGAVYLDGGLEEADKVFRRHFEWLIQKTVSGEPQDDYRTMLQEKVQAVLGVTPRYRLLDEWGEDHCKTFLMGVLTGDDVVGRGSGRNKREAAQNAARNAWEHLDF